MQTITATSARNELFKLIDETAGSHEPILITSRRNNVVMMSEEDYRSICETLYLNAIPNMTQSIQEAMHAKDEDFVDDLKW